MTPGVEYPRDRPHAGNPVSMSIREFRALPELLSRAQVGLCLGSTTYRRIKEITIELVRSDIPVPHGRLGCVRLHTYRKWRKYDVARILGPPYL